MMRMLGFSVLLIAAAMGGNAAAKSLENRVKRLQTLELFCEAVRSELKYLLPTVRELLCNLGEREEFRELFFLRKACDAESFPEGWRAALEADKTLSESERAVLQTLGNTLGSTELSAQLSAIGLCKERFVRLRTASEEEARRCGRLYRSMGILTGIFFVILLL